MSFPSINMLKYRINEDPSHNLMFFDALAENTINVILERVDPLCRIL